MNTGRARLYHCGRKWNEISLIGLLGSNYPNQVRKETSPLPIALSLEKPLLYPLCHPRTTWIPVTFVAHHICSGPTCICWHYLRLQLTKRLTFIPNIKVLYVSRILHLLIANWNATLLSLLIHVVKTLNPITVGRFWLHLAPFVYMDEHLRPSGLHVFQSFWIKLLQKEALLFACLPPSSTLVCMTDQENKSYKALGLDRCWSRYLGLFFHLPPRYLNQFKPMKHNLE